MIKKVDDTTLEKYKNIITPPRNESLEELIFYINDTLWYLNTVGNVDTNRTPRAYFAYLLGNSIVNIPEISLLNENKVEELHSIGISKASKECFIIRVAHEYKTGELPLKSLNEAVAGELVFSLWIRRRDAHNKNRVYNLDGIPLFFDFDVAFLAENEGEAIEKFFERNETGYAGQWQVLQKTNKSGPIDNLFVKENGKQNSIHYVDSIDDFKKCCHNISSIILTSNKDISAITKEAKLSKYDTDNSIIFLMKERDNLMKSVDFMLEKVLNSEVIPKS